MKINTDAEFQKQELEQLRSGEKFSYQNASIYTVLLDLVEGNGLEEVTAMLREVASDLGKPNFFRELILSNNQ